MKKGESKLNTNIDIKGSLGLLAYGDIGLRAWRKEKQKNLRTRKDEDDK